MSLKYRKRIHKLWENLREWHEFHKKFVGVDYPITLIPNVFNDLESKSKF